jgi:hypothetical protein
MWLRGRSYTPTSDPCLDSKIAEETGEGKQAFQRPQVFNRLPRVREMPGRRFVLHVIFNAAIAR